MQVAFEETKHSTNLTPVSILYLELGFYTYLWDFKETDMGGGAEALARSVLSHISRDLKGL